MDKEFLTLREKSRILQEQNLRQVKMYISWFIFHHLHFFDFVRNQTLNKKILLELIKRRSKVQKNNMSRKRALNFVQIG